MFHKYAMLLLVLVLGTQLSACAGLMVGLPLQSAVDEAGAAKLEPFVEVFEVKIVKAVTASAFLGIRVLPAVLKDDMATA